MKERPILFSGPMVRAILDGKKTQTRRVLGVQPLEILLPSDRRAKSLASVTRKWNGCRTWFALTHRGERIEDNRGVAFRCKHGEVGDRFRVAETWAVGKCADGFKPVELDPPTWLGDNGGLWYAADDAKPLHPISERGKWRPGRFMPKRGGFWPSRITLEITAVRVERLQAISEADAKAGGVPPTIPVPIQHPLKPSRILCYGETDATHVEAYRFLWDLLNANRGYGWDVNPWVWVLEFKRIESARAAA